MSVPASSESRRIEYYANFLEDEPLSRRAPSGRRRLRWRSMELVRDEMAAFPHGENDDLHDAAVYGLLRIRQDGLMRLSTDLDAESQPRRPIEYY